MKKPDAYDHAIYYLTRACKKDGNHDSVVRAWNFPLSAYGGILFAITSASRNIGPDLFDDTCGCLTQVRHGFDYSAPNPHLTQQIRMDERIPVAPSMSSEPYSGDKLRPSLEVMAEWQRRLDIALDRESPDRFPQGTPEQIEEINRLSV